MDLREKCERAVLEAAREERAAHKALSENITPQNQNWCDDDEEAYHARLTRWRTASRMLVDALRDLGKVRGNVPV